MKLIFMDANGWIALNSKRDQLHDISIETHKKLLSFIVLMVLYFR